jgi:hypothetical protein
MSEAELCVLERLIDAPDPDIAVSLFDGNSLGQPELDGLMQRLRHFHGIVQGRVSSC